MSDKPAQETTLSGAARISASISRSGPCAFSTRSARSISSAARSVMARVLGCGVFGHKLAP